MEKISIVKPIADFVMRNFDKVQIYAEVHGERRAFITVDDALDSIDGEKVSSFAVKDKDNNVLGEIYVGNHQEEDIYAG